jgi:hypothetical protein
MQSTVVIGARVLLGVIVVAVTGGGILTLARRVSLESEGGLELSPLDPTGLSATELVGAFGGVDSNLTLSAAGRFEYSGGFRLPEYCGFEIASVHAEGKWRTIRAGIELAPDDPWPAPSRLAVWDSEEGLRLTPFSGGFLVDDTLCRSRPAVRPPPELSPGAISR